MQATFKRFSVIGGFAILLIVLIADAYVTKRQLNQQITSAVWVIHTRQVQFELSETASLLKDAETGQRGYLYTGEEKYLDPYNRAISLIGSHVDDLARLTADNPRQQAAIAELRPLVQSKLEELAATIDLFRGDKPDKARAFVRSDTGLRTMEKIRAVLAGMQGEETALESKRIVEYRSTINLTTACIYFTAALATLGLVLLAYYILREMDLRERYTHDLLAREEWFRVTLTGIGDGVIVTDQEGRVTFLNPVAESLTGATTASASGKHILEIFPIFNESTMAPVTNPVAKVIAEGRPMGLANHTVLRKPDGTLTPIADSAAPLRDDSGKLIGVVLIFRDITNDRKTERLLRNAEKLAAAARLSATVAHEINNPLEAAINLIYISRINPEVPSKVFDQLAQAEHELDRVAHITRQTLGFFRDTSAPGPVDVEPLIESVLRLYSNKIQGKNIQIERHFSSCPKIRGKESEIKQILSNLISNGIDASPVGGTITMTLKCAEEEDKTAVHLMVEDDGLGVPEENRERIFEPFFTTKQDVGTGLGLWVSREIIERHGGTISLISRENGETGAAFSLVFDVDGKQ